ncbi:siderophore-interacting protein [Alkanindiges sp. WGS2144]|uniref:siderophore-interacting protein n=1 Tax=Alkanindiges sp. WGS2144 TaxID=3366808 RepID=UPI00375014D7
MQQGDQTRQPRKPYRVRHPLKIRSVTVSNIEKLSPSMLRFVFTDDDLTDFNSASFDDHVKVFFPDPQTGKLVLPQVTEQGITFPEGEQPVMRDYTPRYFKHNQLTIDFALHEAGPATDWAKHAKIGDVLGIGGPRGSMVIPMDFDGYILMGDETALPAIGRRLEELPRDTQVLVIAEVDCIQDQLDWNCPAETEIIWLQRLGQPAGEATLFLQALEQAPFPEGDFHVWIAAETNVARQLRKVLVEDYGINKNYIKAAGYWQLGKSDTHEVLED